MTLDARRLLMTIEGRACSDLSRRVRSHRQAVWPVGMFARFNTFHDLFDALVVQDRLPRNRCQEVSGNGCASSPGSVGTHRVLLRAGFSWRQKMPMPVTSTPRSGPSASTGRSPQCCQMSKQAPSLLRPTADRLMGAVPLNNPGGSTIRLNHSKTFSLEWLCRRRPLMDSNHRPTATTAIGQPAQIAGCDYRSFQARHVSAQIGAQN